MSATVLVAKGHRLSRIPEAMWKGHLAEAPNHIRSRLTHL